MPDPGLHQEAGDASVDFAVAHGEAPLTRHEAFIAGFKAAAASRDQRIKELEEELAEAIDLLREEFELRHRPNHADLDISSLLNRHDAPLQAPELAETEPGS